MTKLSAKARMLAALKKTEGSNTFTVKQAQRRFGVQNVSARIEELLEIIGGFWAIAEKLGFVPNIKTRPKPSRANKKNDRILLIKFCF